MTGYLKSDFIIEEKVIIEDIPTIVFRPKEVKGQIPTVIFYHGWSSSKELQRMRGFILACAGYQVAIPDAILHGERNALSNYGPEESVKYFWDVVFNNIEEYKLLSHGLINTYKADSKRIAVMGNSMGGFTAGGIFTQNEDVKTLIVFNGSCGWGDFNNNFKDVELTEELKLIAEKVDSMDPSNNLNQLKERPILLLHGNCDVVVPIDSQKNFYNKLKPLYKHTEKIKFIEYDRLDHLVTTNMMEDSINWLGKHL
jgi:dienelactone hydrolase